MGSGIRIDKEGAWYYNDAEMIRKEIIMFFSQNLSRNESGEYLIEWEGKQCQVEVEDTPFVIKSVLLAHDADADYFSVTLTDDSVEELVLDSLRISNVNILYSTVKNGKFDARFSRPAYYQLATYIEHDSIMDIYRVVLNGYAYPIIAMNVLSR